VPIQNPNTSQTQEIKNFPNYLVESIMRLEELNQLPSKEFQMYFQGVLEHSPQYATRVFEKHPFADFTALFTAFKNAILEDDPKAQLALIRAHPDLAGKAAIAGELTTESANEQKSAGLDRLTPEEYAEFTRVNTAYHQKFFIPYIVCVREHSKESILAGATERLENTPEVEIQKALEEISKIIKLRLQDLVSG
jgi:OHCU decarboxylase